MVNFGVDPLATSFLLASVSQAASQLSSPPAEVEETTSRVARVLLVAAARLTPHNCFPKRALPNLEVARVEQEGRTFIHTQ